MMKKRFSMIFKNFGELSRKSLLNQYENCLPDNSMVDKSFCNMQKSHQKAHQLIQIIIRNPFVWEDFIFYESNISPGKHEFAQNSHRFVESLNAFYNQLVFHSVFWINYFQFWFSRWTRNKKSSPRKGYWKAFQLFMGIFKSNNFFYFVLKWKI